MTWRNIGTEWIYHWAWAPCRLNRAHHLERAAWAIHAEIHGNESEEPNPWVVRDEMLETLFYQPGTGEVNVPARWYRTTEIGVLCHVLALREKLAKGETFTGRELAILCGMVGSSVAYYQDRGEIAPPVKTRNGCQGDVYLAEDVRAFEEFYRHHREAGR